MRGKKEAAKGRALAVAYFTTYPPADLGDSETPEAVAQRVADRVNQQLQGKPPAGAIHHAEGPTDEGGWWIFDVWALDQDFETFRQQILQPALEGVNVPPPAETRRLQVWWDSSQMGGGS
ncbi:MAG: hypothetical protein QOJ59_3072 [Thermomicrobiales bacterium]|nr:hypothetical protein [Thermomicrobiales bacterium]